MSFLRIRAIVNGKLIYPLPNSKPVVIPVEENKPRIVISDGFHFTKPKKLVFNKPGAHYFKVTCAITDLQLLIGGLLTGVAYLAGIFTGLLPLKVLSFLPILYFVFFYYLNREEFLQLKPL